MQNSISLVQIGPLFRAFGSQNGQGGGLSLRFCDMGFKIHSFSRFENRFIRLINIMFGVFFKLPKAKTLLVHSFGRKAFIIEDFVTAIAVLLNKPIVLRIHGGGFIEFFHRHPKWVRRILNRVTIINTPSLFLQEQLIKLGFNIEYIPNFINLEKFQFVRVLDRRYTLLWVRAFHDTYNPELAIEALHIILKKYPAASLTMVGHDQGLLTRCVELIRSYNLEGKVLITGKVPNDDLHKFYQNHEVFLTTTRYESFGVAIMEAAACGIPCVCVPVGEIPYIWKDRENILFAKRDSKDFAEKVMEIFENKELANYLSINANKRAQKFTWESVKPLWKDTIERLLSVHNVRN